MKYTDPEESKRIAYHEAGHAVMAYLCHVSFQKIVLDLENDECPGYVYYRETHPTFYVPDRRKPNKPLGREHLCTNLLICVAGVQAERLEFLWVTGVSEGDNECAWHFDSKLVAIDGRDPEAGGEYFAQAQDEAYLMLKQYRDALDEVVNRLRQDGALYRVMPAAEFLAIMKKFGL